MISIGLSSEEVRLELGQQYKKYRLLKNWTRETLAERSGVPEPTLKKFEATGKISVESLLALSEALGFLENFKTIVPIESLLVEPDAFKNRKRERGSRP